MPLVLSLRKGQDFFVGDERFVVTNIKSETRFLLAHMKDEETRHRTYEISDAKSTEVLPNVFVSSGEKPETTIARITIEAPPGVLVIRGEKKRNPPPHILAKAV